MSISCETITLRNTTADINTLRNLLVLEINNFKDDETEERRFVAQILDFTFKDVISVEISKGLFEKSRYYYICFRTKMHYSFENLDWTSNVGGSGTSTGSGSGTGSVGAGEWGKRDKASNTWTTISDIKQIKSGCFERTCAVRLSDEFNYHLRIEIEKDTKEYWLGDCWCWVYHDAVDQDDVMKSAFVKDGQLKLLEIFESREIFPNYFEIGSNVSRELSKYFNWDIVGVCCKYY